METVVRLLLLVLKSCEYLSFLRVQKTLEKCNGQRTPVPYENNGIAGNVFLEMRQLLRKALQVVKVLFCVVSPLLT